MEKANKQEEITNYLGKETDEEETIEWILNMLSNINLESKTKKDYKKEFL